MSQFEKIFIIIQQLPVSVKRASATVNLNNTQIIGQTLANLDEMYLEKSRIMDRKYNNNQNSTEGESAQIQQINIHNNHRGYNRRGIGRFANNRYNNGNRNNITRDVNTITHGYQTNTQQNGNLTVGLPDTRFPLPSYFNSRTSLTNNNHLNE